MDGLSLMLLMLFFKVAASFCLIVFSPTLVWLARKRVPLGTNGRTAFLYACGLTPTVVFLWCWLIFAGYSRICRIIYHQDDGLTDDPFITLATGYTVGKPVDYCWGSIAAPGVRTASFDKCHAKDGSGHVTLIGTIQLAGSTIAGHRDIPPDGDDPDRPVYFLLDQKTGAVQGFAGEGDLQVACESKGFNLSLEYVGDFYRSRRVHWVDWLLVPIQFLGMVGVVSFLLLWSRGLNSQTQ